MAMNSRATKTKQMPISYYLLPGKGREVTSEFECDEILIQKAMSTLKD